MNCFVIPFDDNQKNEFHVDLNQIGFGSCL